MTTPATATSDHRTAVTAGFLGWTLDAFDFFLVTLCLTAIGKDLGASDKQMAGAIGLTLMFRPVGALVFGLLADRYGRRIPLMLNLVFYSAATVATGLVQSFSAFLLLRALFGIGMGGEWGVGASLVMEKVPPKLRGVFSGLLQQGYALGNLLAAGCYWYVFPRYGWRPLFFIGGLPALLAIYVRSHVKESEVWHRTRVDLKSYFGTLAQHLPLLLYIAVLMTGMNFASHGTQDLYPTFLQRDWGFTPGQRAALTAWSMVGALCGGVICGFYSERIGRRRMIVYALCAGVVSIPAWAFAPSLPVLVLGAFLMQFCVQGAWGVIPAHITELSPDQVRGFMPGFAYQCGVALAGYISYVEAFFAGKGTYAQAMAYTAATVFLFASVMAIVGKERRGRVYGATS